MKQKKRIKWMVCVTCFLMCLFLPFNRSHAESPQSDNIVTVEAFDATGSSMGWATGFVIEQKNDHAIVMSVSSEVWDQAAEYEIAGAVYEKQPVRLQKNDLNMGVAIFETDLEGEGFLHTSIATYDELFTDQLIYQGAFNIDLLSESYEEAISYYESTICEAVNIGDYSYIKMNDPFPNGGAGGPVFLEDGRLVGMMLGINGEALYFLPIEYILNGAIGDSWYEQLGTVDQVLMWMIPFLAVIFVISFITYKANESSRKRNGGEEFANVLSRGGEEGLRLRGKSGYFKDMDFPLTSDIIFGRDKSQSSAVYPDDTKGISRKHCKLHVSEDNITLIDLGSTYGTFLADGTRLEPGRPYVINFGDEFYLVDPGNTFRVI